MPNPVYTKLYVDLVAPDGTVCIAYASWLTILGRRFFLGGVETHSPDGSHRRERALGATISPNPARPARPCPRRGCTPSPDYTVLLWLPGGAFTLTFTDMAEAPAPASPVAGLTWSVLTPRAHIYAAWPDGSGQRPISGAGYADWVTLERPTRSLPIRRLDWGRIHIDARAAVFARIGFRDGGTWERTVVAPQDARSGAPVEAARVCARWKGGELLVGPDEGATEYSLRPQRVLHEGTVTDADRFPNVAERAIVAAFTGPSHETRWLSEVRATGGSRGWALHEEVDFGRRPAGRPVSSRRARRSTRRRPGMPAGGAWT